MGLRAAFRRLFGLNEPEPQPDAFAEAVAAINAARDAGADESLEAVDELDGAKTTVEAILERVAQSIAIAGPVIGGESTDPNLLQRHVAVSTRMGGYLKARREGLEMILREATEQLRQTNVAIASWDDHETRMSAQITWQPPAETAAATPKRRPRRRPATAKRAPPVRGSTRKPRTTKKP